VSTGSITNPKLRSAPSSFGAGITRHLVDLDIAVLEVDRPDPSERRRKGKDDDLDAIKPPAPHYKPGAPDRHNRPRTVPNAREAAVHRGHGRDGYLRIIQILRL
jgi:hypothetical protein